MERIQIVAETRVETGKGAGRKLRRSGMIPAVAYGAGYEKPLQISLPSKPTATLVNRRNCKGTVVELVVNGQPYPAMLKEYQVHPIARTLTHLDFILLKVDQPCQAEVPVDTTGKSEGEELGAKLYIARREITVRCLPHLVPEKLVVDVTGMKLNEVRYVDQLGYPEGVAPVYRTRYPVVVVQKLKVVEEAAPKAAEAVEGAAVEGAPAEGEAKAEGAAAAAPAAEGDKKAGGKDKK
jgi:large subunit ribosomal protein L25